MNRLASPAQLRASMIRWALFLIPAVMLLGFLSGQLAASGPDNPWFAGLVKPELYPPPATFGIVWSILYFMMGLSGALIGSAWGSRWRGWALLAFVVQLALNLAWSPVFFTMHDLPLAFYVIVALWIAIVVTIFLAARVRKLAAWLLVPYLVWVSFAAGLTWQIWQDNPTASDAGASNAVQRIEL